jgi:catechol 2,3-dioxygenase-like lactoylglutathione lyase family enzyme
MAGVTGIGGVFFKARNRETLAAWYRDKLGVPVQAWHGAQFHFADDKSPREHGYAVWALFAPETKHFGGGPQTFMVNYRVDDLDALLAKLRADGVPVDDNVSADENGKFGWVTDPEGNRVELWQPPSA